MEVHIVRHTRVAVGRETCYGQSDVALAESFAEEAAAYHHSLPTDFDAVFCSPLSRCQKLAKELDRGAIVSDARLLELNFGIWENLLWNDIDQEALGHWMEDFVGRRPPEGESMSDIYARCASFFDELITQPHEKVLVVAHAGIVRCVWAYVLGIPLNRLFRLPVGFGETLVLNHAIKPDYRKFLQKA